jgi:Immunity protein 26
MPDYPPVNFKRLRPSRAKIASGDIFTMRLPDGRYVFGRVVRTDANCFGPNCILVYVFRYLSPGPDPPARLLVKDLLIPPTTINRLGWSRGYFLTVGRRPFEDGERLSNHYFRDVRRGRSGETLYVDENGKPLGRPPRGALVRRAGLGNYRTVDDDVSDALGIAPAAPETD